MGSSGVIYSGGIEFSKTSCAKAKFVYGACNCPRAIYVCTEGRFWARETLEIMLFVVGANVDKLNGSPAYVAVCCSRAAGELVRSQTGK